MDSLALHEIFEKIENMDSVTKFQQRENATLLDVRLLFDSVISKYPQLESLGDQAPIIPSNVFETELVKIQDGKKNKLDVDEVASTKCFQVKAASQDINAEIETSSDFAESILKKKTWKNDFGKNKRFYWHKIFFADVEYLGTFFQQRGLCI